jgi:hypothetical protein
MGRWRGIEHNASLGVPLFIHYLILPIMQQPLQQKLLKQQLRQQ